jgi:hypothetical protein
MNLKIRLEKSLKKRLAKNRDKNLVNSLEKNQEKNRDTDNCVEFGRKRVNTTKLTCSITIVAIISLALPLPLGASPEPLVASPELLAAGPKSVATKGAVGGSAGGRSAWCHAVVSQPLPGGAVVGNIDGRPFKPEFIQWNSYSITLKQNRKRLLQGSNQHDEKSETVV